MEEDGEPAQARLPLLPGFREMALRRMSEERRLGYESHAPSNVRQMRHLLTAARVDACRL